MQFTFFHLMPYRPLDMAERHKHRAAWVVLPNALYDPKKGADEYQSYIDQLVYAEKLGFDVIAVNEHHQTAYGMMPAPNLIAANLIARTSKVKIAIVGRALPLVNNPVNIAEEFAMLDNLSKGRIITGFVRGIGNEYHATGINPYWSHERFQEAHDLIVQAWTKPGPFAFEGEHYNIRYVNLWPRPYQTPHPPIWIPSMGSSETIKWAADPERKYPFLVTFSGRELVARYLNLYREQARQFGYEASPEPARLGLAGLCRRHRRARQGGGPGRHGDAVQRFPRGAVPDAAAARLHLAVLDEEHHEDAQAARRAEAALARGADGERHRGGRLAEDGARRAVAAARRHRRGNLVTMLQFGVLPDDLTGATWSCSPPR